MARIEVHPLPLHGEVTRAVLASPPEIRLGKQPAVARRDVQLKAWLDLWLYIHVPLSIALVVTLAIHIVSVFFYW